jgi:adenylyltransferase/sulfurtransferase
MKPVVPDARLAAAPLSDEEISRYARHLVLPEVGREGQSRLKAASVLLVGAGGLGSPAALFLAAAGVGRLALVDPDRVDASNLQRQVLHGTRDVSRPKVASAADRLRDLNPHLRVDLHEARFSAANAAALVAAHDLVLDGTDNFPARYLVNDACVLGGKPNVYAAIFRFEGQASVFAPCLGGPCYRCLFPEPPPAGAVPGCAEGGVLGVLPGLLGTVQATEALKLLLGLGSPLVGRLLLYDALAMRFREMSLRRNPDCPVCGPRPTITRLMETAPACAPTPKAGEITARELKKRLDANADFDLIDVREPAEWQVSRLPRARLIPLGELAKRIGELDPGREVVVYCKAGVRGGKALGLLRQHGFARARNLAGGLEAWAADVDPSMPRA